MKLSVLPSARTDIRNQIEYYHELGLPHVADHFALAVSNAISAATKRPAAGSPRRLANPAFAGLRTWTVKASISSAFITSPVRTHSPSFVYCTERGTSIRSLEKQTTDGNWLAHDERHNLTLGNFARVNIGGR